MKARTKKKTFDCVKMKRQAQSRIYEETKGFTPEQEIEYFHRQAQTGPLAAWWKRVTRNNPSKNVRR